MISYYKQVCKLPEATGKQFNSNNILHAQLSNLQKHLWQSINSTEKAVCNAVHIFLTWAFHFENHAHITHLSETEFQLIISPFSNRDTNSNEMLYVTTRMTLASLYGCNNVLTSAHHKFLS